MVKAPEKKAKQSGNVGREVERLNKKLSGLNDEYVKELQDHRYDVEEARDEFTRLRAEQVKLRQDVEIERQARIAAEEVNKPEGALKQMKELKQLAVQAVAEAEEAREEAEEATELAMAFEQEADEYKRDVEHLEKTARNLKSKNKKLEFDLQRMAKGGPTRRTPSGAKYMDEDEVAKIYGEEIKALKAEVEMLGGKSEKLSAANVAAKMRHASLQKKYDDLVANGGAGGAGGGGFQVSANEKQLYIATADMSLFRRTVDKEMDKEEKFEGVKGTLQCISVSEKWIWGCNKSGEVMLANVEDKADAHEWKGPGDSPDPTLVAGVQKALRVATADEYCYVTTKKRGDLAHRDRRQGRLGESARLANST